MRKYLMFTAVGMLCLLFVPTNAQNKSRINFDKDWKFKLDIVLSLYNDTKIERMPVGVHF